MIRTHRHVAFSSVQKGGSAGFVDRKYIGFVSFNPMLPGTNSVSSAIFQVPLPAGIWLLLAGVGGFAFVGRKFRNA